MTNDELLEKLGKLLNARFEAEREHTRQLVREEIEAVEKRVSTQIETVEKRLYLKWPTN